MNDETKVMLSAGELALAANKEVILTKRIITEKASLLFSGLVPVIKDLFLPVADEQIQNAVPKISKGENYNGFPYVIMDYPAVFGKEHVFAVRTMFWWGNFISITLQLSGTYKALYEEKILRTANDLLFVCVNTNEWQHHFEEDNYVSMALLTAAQRSAIRAQKFMKVALKYELHHWNMMQSILPEGYRNIFTSLIS